MGDGPLKVLYLINGLGTGGAERSLFELLGPLAHRGIEITVCCLYRRGEGVEAEVVTGGSRVIWLHKESWWGRVLEFRRILAAERPDVLHTTIFESDLVGRIAAVGTGVPVVSSVVNTGFDPVRRSDPSIHQAKLRIAQWTDGITCRVLGIRIHAISDAVKRDLVERAGVRPDRVTVIPRGRDLARLGQNTPERRAQIRQRIGIDCKAPVLITVGRQEFQKGQRYLVNAISILRAEYPDLILLMAGRRGRESTHLDAVVEEFGLGSSIRMLGHRTDIPDLLCAADLFVFPSLYEGLGGAVLEAMAIGLPIVASDLPAIREVAEPSGACFVPKGSPQALATAIAHLLSDPQRRAAMSAVNQHHGTAFSIDLIADQMETFYKAVADHIQ